jgi:AraC-like DNA-binding protein
LQYAPTGNDYAFGGSDKPYFETGNPPKSKFVREQEKMTIPLTRCQFIIPLAAICDAIGAPTEAMLTRFLLPVSLEAKPEHYVPILQAVRFAEAIERSQGIADVGFQAARLLHFGHVSEKVRALVRFSPTLFIALQQLCKWASIEDTTASVWLEREDNHVRICSKLAGAARMPHLEHSQWLQNVYMMHIVRQFSGPQWAPATMAFEARYEPSLETRSSWQNTRFISEQNSSWIDIPVSFLDLPNLANETAAPSHSDGVEPSGHEIVSAVKLMLPSYLEDGIPTLAEIAEMAGISIRSFQRKLSSAGVSYTDLLDGVRYENAAKLLRDTDAKIIDVAFSSGYSDPAHFTRAFRRFSGTTPSEFRGRWKPQ